MLSSFAIVNSHGSIILSKDFRGEKTEDLVKDFCDTYIRTRAAHDTPPLVRNKNATIAFLKTGSIYLVGATLWDTNGALLQEMLRAIADGFQQYFGHHDIKADDVSSRLALLYVLLDEMVEYGYPQLMSTEVLARYLGDTGILPKVERSLTQSLKRDKQASPPSHTVTLDVTGAVPWRRQGVHYKNNEVWMDIQETVNATIMPNGECVAADVVGAIKIKCHLSGMPECKVGLNDRLSLQVLDQARTGDVRYGDQQGQGGVNLEGVSLHQCVRLSDFETKREIAFTPPDGEFKLITYRMVDNIILPFKLTTACKQHGRTRYEMQVSIRSLYPKAHNAFMVRIFIPVPPATTKVHTRATGGRCRTDLAAGHYRWKFKELGGQQEHSLHADINLIATNTDKDWEKPPVRVTFELPELTASGLKVRFFNVFERTGYTTNKWVRYDTTSGVYETRLP